MVSSFDAIAWIDPRPSMGIAMSETLHSSSEPQCPNIVDLALSVDFDGYADIFVDFMKEIRNADQKTPEEIEKTRATFDARLTAFKRDESKRLFEGILSVVKREVSSARSQNIYTEDSAVRVDSTPALPDTKPVITKRVIKKIVDQIDFD